jgi:hypothetical protein
MLWLLYLFQRPFRKSSTSLLQNFFAYAFQDLHCSVVVISSSRKICAMQVASDMTRFLGDFFDFFLGDRVGDRVGDRGDRLGLPKPLFHEHALWIPARVLVHV